MWCIIFIINYNQYVIITLISIRRYNKKKTNITNSLRTHSCSMYKLYAPISLFSDSFQENNVKQSSVNKNSLCILIVL